MKLFLITIFIGLSAAGKLSNTYLPPQSANTAGGHGGFLQGPQHQHQPSNQYIPPQTNYNQHGQPVQWSHGGWNAGQASGSQSYQGSGSTSTASFSSNHLGGSGGSNYHKQNAPVIPILKFDSENDGNGNYHFDYQTGNGIQAQEQGHIENPNTDWSENVVQGSYSYTGDDGKQYSVKYEADGNGFRPTGDHLPTPPPQPREIQEVWDRVLAEQAQHAAQGGWQQGGGHQQSASHQQGSYQQQGGGHQQSGSHQQGSYQHQGGHQQGGHQQGGFASGSSFHQQQQSHGAGAGSYPQQRPQTPHNQYLPPTSGGAGGYQY